MVYDAGHLFQNNMEWGNQTLKRTGYQGSIFVGGHHSNFVYFKSILSKMFAEMGRGVHREPN